MHLIKPAASPLTRDEWRLVLLLSAINFVHILDFVIVMPLGDLLRHELSITPRQFGFVVSAYGICAMVAGVIAATVIDRFDRRRTMLIAFVGFLATTLYCGLAPNYEHLLLARGLAGLCGGIVASTVMAFIVDLIPEQRRGRAIGIVTSSFAFASTIGLPMRLLRDVPGQANHLWSFAFMLAMVFGTFMIVPYIAPYLQANCGLASKHLPLIYAVAGVFALLTMNVSGWMTDRFGARVVFAATAGSAVVMTVVITNLPQVSLWIAILVTTLFMSVASSRMVPAQAMMLRSADPTSRGAFTSLNTAVSHFATGVGPLISGAIIGESFPGGPLTHYWLAGWVAVFFGLLAIGLSFLLRPAPNATFNG